MSTVPETHLVRAADLDIYIHGKVVALHARVLPPDIGSNGAEQAHAQLHADDEGNLKIEKAVVWACKHEPKYISLSLFFKNIQHNSEPANIVHTQNTGNMV